MKQPHKHAELIKAWADGAEIEYKSHVGGWHKTEWPNWDTSTEYRIKPEPKPDIVKEMVALDPGSTWFQSNPNLRLTFSGETGELIKAEVLK